jgi:hypothetical protein
MFKLLLVVVCAVIADGSSQRPAPRRLVFFPSRNVLFFFHRPPTTRQTTRRATRRTTRRTIRPTTRRTTRRTIRPTSRRPTTRRTTRKTSGRTTRRTTRRPTTRKLTTRRVTTRRPLYRQPTARQSTARTTRPRATLRPRDGSRPARVPAQPAEEVPRSMKRQTSPRAQQRDMKQQAQQKSSSQKGVATDAKSQARKKSARTESNLDGGSSDRQIPQSDGSKSSFSSVSRRFWDHAGSYFFFPQEGALFQKRFGDDKNNVEVKGPNYKVDTASSSSCDEKGNCKSSKSANLEANLISVNGRKQIGENTVLTGSLSRGANLQAGYECEHSTSAGKCKVFVAVFMLTYFHSFQQAGAQLSIGDRANLQLNSQVCFLILWKSESMTFYCEEQGRSD